MRLELQADFLAGIYAHHAEKRGYLERGDMNEALNAASQIGDECIDQKGDRPPSQRGDPLPTAQASNACVGSVRATKPGNVMLMSQLMEWDYRDL